MSDYAALRARMVEDQIADRGVRDQQVLAALREVPREVFVPAELAARAYTDAPLPVAAGQTISQPYIVALMVEALALQPGDRVLDIGTGSGYAAAVMSRIVAEVYGVERHAALVDYALERFESLAYRNIHLRRGDGSLGWPEQAPFDAIMIAAAGPRIPMALRAQLTEGGRLVMPVGPEGGVQSLVRLIRTGPEDYRRETLCDVRFVPLIGSQGWGER
jgi:protein-L-isoaspartate(D-aspartate) O-methyltransferase